VTPFALWTHILLKGGEGMLDSMHAAVRRARPAVGVIPTEDAPKPGARRSPRKRVAKRAAAKAKGKAKPKRKARARSAKARRR
jgi:hypothetical protein